MALKDIGQNSAQEFFETLIYLTAYDEARTIIQTYTKDIDNPVLREAVEDSLNVLTFGLIFYLIQMEESFLERIFNIASGFVAFLVGSVGRFKKRMLGKRGIRGFLGSLFSRYSDESRLKIAEIVVNQTGNLIQARSNSYSSNKLYKSYSDTKLNIYSREKLHLDLANSYSKQYVETLLFKLFTKNFTANDELLLKKILGRDSVGSLSVDDINQVADFIYVKDDTGKVIGLSEAFLQLINGLGYLHK